MTARLDDPAERRGCGHSRVFARVGARSRKVRSKESQVVRSKSDRGGDRESLNPRWEEDFDGAVSSEQRRSAAKRSQRFTFAGEDVKVSLDISRLQCNVIAARRYPPCIRIRIYERTHGRPRSRLARLRSPAMRPRAKCAPPRINHFGELSFTETGNRRGARSRSPRFMLAPRFFSDK